MQEITIIDLEIQFETGSMDTLVGRPTGFTRQLQIHHI